MTRMAQFQRGNELYEQTIIIEIVLYALVRDSNVLLFSEANVL